MSAGPSPAMKSRSSTEPRRTLPLASPRKNLCRRSPVQATEHRPLQTRQVGIAGKISLPHSRGTGDRCRIIVERGDCGTERARRIAKQATAAAYVEKPKAVKPRQAETVNQRLLCKGDALI